MCTRYVSIQQTIRYSIWKISDIACGPPFWTVLVSWYPHHDLRFSLNIYVWVGGIFSLIYYVILRQNSLCKLIWSFFSFLATSEHRRQDFLFCPALPTHLSMIIMLCCMLLLNCSYLFIYLFPYSRRLAAGGVRFAMSLHLVEAHDAHWCLISTWPQFARASFCIMCNIVTSCYFHL